MGNSPQKGSGQESEVRSFRKSADLEAFYRFIHENNLRREAHVALEFIVSRLKASSKKKSKKKKK